MLALGLASIALLPGAAQSGCAPGCYPVGDFAPQWSADGAQIAYFRGAGSAFESTLVRINARGQERIEVPNPSSNAFPAAVLYSPDLSLITYPSQSGPLVVRSFSGGPERAIAPRLTIPVAWSPDGARIAYPRTASTSASCAQTPQSPRPSCRGSQARPPGPRTAADWRWSRASGSTSSARTAATQGSSPTTSRPDRPGRRTAPASHSATPGCRPLGRCAATRWVWPISGAGSYAS